MAHPKSHLGFFAFIAVLVLVLAPAALASDAPSANAERELASAVTARVRVAALTPAEPVRIYFRTGGEGWGGPVVRGELTRLPADAREASRVGRAGVDYEPADAKPGAPVWLTPGAWSPEVPISTFDPHGRPPFVTFTADGMKSGAKSPAVLRNVVFEIQIRHRGRVLKTVVEKGPDGPTATMHIAFERLGAEAAPSQAFLDETTGVSTWAARRLRYLESLPWAHQPVPKRFAILTDVYGYAPGAGFSIRSTDKDVILTELRSARLLGVNGLRQTPPFVIDMLKAKEGIGAEFSRVRGAIGVGYTVPAWDFHKNLAAGCPYHPSRAGWRERMKAQCAWAFSDPARRASAEELWLLEVDEVGSVFDVAPESKAHQGACPYCRQAFHDYLKSFGLRLSDFDAKSWDDIRSTYGYWDKTYAEKQAAAAAATAAPAPSKLDGYQIETGAADQKIAHPGASTVPEPGAPAGPPPIVQNGRRAPMSEKGWALLYNYSRRFNADSSAMLLGPAREYFDAQNEAKRRAIAEGRLDSPEAKQPWAYTYALRGVNFLIGGHSLDYFDFFRQADNAFMYETSNRDPRTWQWDSYMCDIGRILSDRMGKRFGVYIKPHRGAVIQRALTAASREAKTLFWYTYGPDWVKADSFSERPAMLAQTSRAARLLAASEDVIYDSKWAVAPEIAVVRPRTSEFFENNASWENGKWIYTALTHAHLPVDALDEGFLESDDLSRYKAIYVSGSHLRKASAQKLVRWVEHGGTLYTSGWGLARDEADQPLTALAPVLGLKTRGKVELWNDVWRYGATTLPPLRKVTETPAYANATGQAPFSGTMPIAVGREVLEPAQGTEVLATYGDGKPAVTRHAYGKGAAFVVGFYAGFEYSVDLISDSYDMSKDFKPVKASFVTAPALAAGVRPVVDAASPLVEGVLLRNTKTGKLSVSLMNWAYKTRPPDPKEFPPMNWDSVPFEGLSVDVHHVGRVARVQSAWSGRAVPFVQKGDTVTVTLPKLEEADVLLFD